MTSRLWPLAASICQTRRAPFGAVAVVLAGGLLAAGPVPAGAASGGAGLPSSTSGHGQPPSSARAHRAHRARHARRASYSPSPLAGIQRILGVTADGAWGPRTAQALQRWQEGHGLPATGVTDLATVRSLGLDPSSDPPVPALTSPAPDAVTGPPPAVGAELAKIAQCESGGDIHQLSYHGTYRGKYQFDMESWFRAGGLVDPAQAPESEQTQRAAWILATQGRSAWPNCS